MLLTPALSNTTAVEPPLHCELRQQEPAAGKPQPVLRPECPHTLSAVCMSVNLAWCRELWVCYSHSETKLKYCFFYVFCATGKLCAVFACAVFIPLCFFCWFLSFLYNKICKKMHIFNWKHFSVCQTVLAINAVQHKVKFSLSQSHCWSDHGENCTTPTLCPLWATIQMCEVKKI